jgi:hypothetical protein
VSVKDHVLSLLEKRGPVSPERLAEVLDEIACVAFLEGGAACDETGDVFGPSDPRWHPRQPPPLPSIIRGKVT